MVELSIIVPCFNEESSLESCVAELDREAGRCVASHEIIVVNDGSLDRTEEVARVVSERIPSVRWISKPNGGIGSAVTLGFSHATGRTLTYAPADAQFDPAEIPLLLEALRHADVVIGYKSSFASYTKLRRIHSWSYRFLLRLLFSIESPDVNFIHAYRVEAYRTIVPRSRGSFFHAETIARALREGLRVAQIPLTLRTRTSGSAKGANPRAILRILREMWSFYRFGTLR